MIEFTAQQERVIQEGVDWFKNSSEQTFEIAGEAGTGKSVVLNEIIRRLGLEDFEYMPMAFTGQAAIVMRLKGFTKAKSIHSSLYKLIIVPKVDENGNIMMDSKLNIPITTKKFIMKDVSDISPLVKLFVIDEGYMVDANMRKTIESFGRKVLVAGDDGQLPPIGGDPGYLTGYGVHRLTDLMRQAEGSPIIYIAHRARQGLPIHCGIYGNNVLVIDDVDLRPQMIAMSQSIVCGTNYTRDMMNKFVREQLRGIHSDLPAHGERMICRDNNWDIERDNISLANGLIGTVVNMPSVYGFDDKHKTFVIDFVPDLWPVKFENIKVNYEYYKAPYEERKVLKLNKWSKGEKFEFAYATTAYLTQGAEFHTGMYIEEFLRPNVQNQLNYTGITRFKNNLIYVKKSKALQYYIGQSYS